MIRTLITISLFLFSISFESQMAAQATTQQPVRKLTPNSSQWALLIGVSDYPDAINDLRFPGADARSIKELLISSAGFAEDHVRLLTDDGVGEAKATKQNIFSAIDQYLAPRVQSGHEIIIFIAGHGVVRGLGTEARSYYLPVDVDAQTKESLERTAVDMEELSRKLSMLKASQFTVFYDACREDPYPGRGLKGNALTDVTARILTTVSTRLPQPRMEPPTSVIFYACQVGERAFENPRLQHGVFTYYILRGLRELANSPDGRVEAGQLAGYLSENVRLWIREAKIPFEQNPTMVATDVRGPVLVARVTPLSAKVPEPATPAGVLINTFPEGATLSINGQQTGRGPIQKDLPPNQYTVRAELPGFQPAETRVNVITGYRQEITITLRPLAADSNYEKGIQFEKQQLLPQAIAFYQQALLEDSNSMAAYERLAQAYVRTGRYREAVNLLTVASLKFPSNALILARRSRANSALRAGEDDLATSPAPSTPQSNETSGETSGEAPGKGGKKSKKSKKKDEVANSADETQSGKGGKKSKKSKKSKKKDEEAGAQPPISQSFAPQSGAPQSDEGSGKKSKKSKSGKESKKSKNDSTDETRGRSLTVVAPVEAQQQGAGLAAGAGDAIRDAELAVQNNDRLAEAHLALGFALLAEGTDYDRALTAFIQASTIAPEDPEAYFGAGYVYRLKQQCQQAVPQLKRAIELRPNYYQAQREMAYCYHALGATDQAIRQYVVTISYRAATSDSSEMAANNLALGALYRKKGDEIGGAQGEEYRKAGKACEDDAREYEPGLKGAVKKLALAGVLQSVGENAPPEIRNLPGMFNIPKGVNAPTGYAVPCPCAPNESKGKESKKTKFREPKENKGPSISIGIPIGIPIGPGPRRPPRGDRPPSNTNPPPRGDKPPSNTNPPRGDKPPSDTRTPPKLPPRPPIRVAPRRPIPRPTQGPVIK
jgi:tetratricopeptide (TPR) repeat protein